MARGPQGTYTLPLPPVNPDELIESNWANTSLDDISGALTDSLSRSGKGGMTAAFAIFDGTITAPGLAFTTEGNSGLYKAAAGEIRMSALGTDCMRWTAGEAQTLVGGLWKTVVGDAPSDNAYYSRRDGVWAVAPAPPDPDKLDRDGADGGMLAILDMGNFAIDNMDEGTTLTSAINRNQLNAGLTGVLEGDLPFTKAVIGELKSTGTITRKDNNLGNGSASVDVSTLSAFYVGNIGPGDLTLTFNNWPNGSDPDLGGQYSVQGSIQVKNGGGTPGNVILVVTGYGGNVRTSGTFSTLPNQVSILQYRFDYIDGTTSVIWIWTVAT
jgi:hypothetical protein